MTITPARSIKPAYAIGAIATLLGLEAVSGVVYSYRSIQAWIPMSTVNLAASLCLFAIFCWRGGSIAKALRLQWVSLASGLAISTVALILWTYILFADKGNWPATTAWSKLPELSNPPCRGRAIFWPAMEARNFLSFFPKPTSAAHRLWLQKCSRLSMSCRS